MAISVRLRDGRVIDFPESYSQEQIKSYLLNNFDASELAAEESGPVRGAADMTARMGGTFLDTIGGAADLAQTDAAAPISDANTTVGRIERSMRQIPVLGDALNTGARAVEVGENALSAIGRGAAGLIREYGPGAAAPIANLVDIGANEVQREQLRRRQEENAARAARGEQSLESETGGTFAQAFADQARSMADAARDAQSEESKIEQMQLSSAFDEGIGKGFAYAAANPFDTFTSIAPEVGAFLLGGGIVGRGAKTLGAADEAAAAISLQSQGAAAAEMNASGAAKTVRELSDERIAELPMGQELMAQGLSVSEAREEMARRAYDATIGISAPLNAALMGATQKLNLNPVETAVVGGNGFGSRVAAMEGLTGRLARGAAGFAAEGTSEFVEEGADKLASNLGEISGGAREGKDVLEGTATAGAMGLLAGGAMGGGLGLMTAPLVAEQRTKVPTDLRDPAGQGEADVRAMWAAAMRGEEIAPPAPTDAGQSEQGAPTAAPGTQPATTAAPVAQTPATRSLMGEPADDLEAQLQAAGAAPRVALGEDPGSAAFAQQNQPAPSPSAESGESPQQVQEVTGQAAPQSRRAAPPPALLPMANRPPPPTTVPRNLQAADLVTIPPAQTGYAKGVRPMEVGEDAKPYLKKNIDTLPDPKPGQLPVDTSARYFSSGSADSVVPLSALKPSKVEEPGNAAIKRMAATAAGVIARRDPIDVEDNGDGTYTIVDGNGSYNAARKIGLADMPVRIVKAPPGKEPWRQNRGMLTPEQDAQLLSTYEQAAAELPSYDKTLKSLALNLGGEAVVAPLKGRTRAEQKIRDDYKGDVSQIKDLLRGTLKFATPQQAIDAANKLRAQFEMVKDKDGLSPGTPDKGFGYRDINMVIRMPGGTLAEVQLMTTAMAKAKSEAHKHYDVTRALQEKFEKGTATAAEKKAYAAAEAAMWKAYEEAAALDSDATNSARVTGDQESGLRQSTASTPLTGDALPDGENLTPEAGGGDNRTNANTSPSLRSMNTQPLPAGGTVTPSNTSATGGSPVSVDGPIVRAVQAVMQALGIPETAVTFGGTPAKMFGEEGARALGLDARTEGVYMDGRVIIFQDNIANQARAIWVFLHEHSGHHGVRSLLGDRYATVMNYAASNPLVKAIADDMRREAEAEAKAGAKGARNLDDPNLFTEEALVELQAAVVTGDFGPINSRYPSTRNVKRESAPGLIQRVINAIKAALGKAGAPKMTDAEVAQLLRDARRMARTRPTTPDSVMGDTIGEGMSMPAQSRAEDPRTNFTKKISEEFGLTEAELGATSIPLLYPNGKLERKSRKIGGLTDVAKFFERRSRESLGRSLEITDPQDQERIARMMAAETVAAARDQSEAKEWYDAAINRTLSYASVKFPELQTDPNARMAYTLSLAVTSQGMNVLDNSAYAATVYSEFRNTGRFPIRGWGKHGEAMEGNFQLANALLDRFGADDMRRFLATEFTVAELATIGYEIGGEAAGTKVLGSSVFGPKIGFGFYSNLNGNFEPITIDMWFMRTIGRYIGKIMAFNPDLLAKQIKDLRLGLKQSGSDGLYYADVADRVGQIDADNATDEEIMEAAFAIKRAHEKDFKDNRAQFDAKTRRKTGMVSAAENIVKNLKAPKDAPTTADRAPLRQIVSRAVELTEQALGYRAPPAAMQAMIWYPEQYLYADFGVKLKAVGEDYAKGTRAYLKREGYTDEQLDRAERGSGVAQRLAGESDAGVDVGDGEQGTRPVPLQGGERVRFIQRLAVHGVRSDTGSHASASGPYSRRSEPNGRGVRLLGGWATQVAEFSLPIRIKNKLKQAGIDAPKIVEIKSDSKGAEMFKTAITQAKDANEFGAAVYVYDSYEGMRLFVTPDGKAGFAIKPGPVNDIVSVFGTPGSYKGVAHPMLMLAVQEGGKKLDAFDTVLPEIYAAHGFRTAAKMQWSDDFAPEGWDKAKFSKYKNGEPDVVFMAHDAGFFGTPDVDQAPYIEDYDSAVQQQEQVASGAAVQSRAAVDGQPGVRRDDAGQGAVVPPVQVLQSRAFPADAPAFRQRKQQADAVSAQGIHYSGAAGLTALDAKFAGSGSAGAERRRFGMGQYGANAAPGDTGRRLYFYVQEGDAPPRKEDVVAGNNRYAVNLTNLYDVEADPRGLREEAGSNPDYLEELVNDAGFDGMLLPPLPGIDGKTAILHGLKKKVPVVSAPMQSRAPRVELDEEQVFDLIQSSGLTVQSMLDAQKALSNGDAVFVSPEMDEEPVLATSLDMLEGYTPEQVMVVPRSAYERATGGVMQSRAPSKPQPGVPTPLYADRPVVNDGGLRQWAIDAGLTDVLPAEEMHVTVTYSRAPVDVADVAPDEAGLAVRPAGRAVQLRSALAMPVASMALQRGHRRYRDAGASHDYGDQYTPHITLKYDPTPEDIAALEAAPRFTGTIRLGPERHDVLKPGDAPATPMQSRAPTKEARATAKSLRERKSQLARELTQQNVTVEQIKAWTNKARLLIGEVGASPDFAREIAEAKRELTPERRDALQGDRAALNRYDEIRDMIGMLDAGQRAVRAKASEANRLLDKVERRTSAMSLTEREQLLAELSESLDKAEQAYIAAKTIADWRAKNDFKIVKAYRKRNEVLSYLASEGYQQGSMPWGTGPLLAKKDRALRKIRRVFQDRLIDLRDVQEQIENEIGRSIDDMQNVYRAENQMHGKTADAIQGFHEKMRDPLIDSINATGLSLATVERYLWAKHARERNAKIAAIRPGVNDGSGMTNDEADAIIGAFTPEQIRKLDAVSSKVQEVRRFTLSTMVQSGQIDQKSADAMLNAYADYVPLRGKDEVGDERVGQRRGTGQGISAGGTGIVRALGRKTPPKNILAELVGDAERSIVQAGKAEVGRALLRMALSYPNPEIWEIQPVELKPTLNEATGEVYLAVTSTAQQDADSIVVKHNGKPYRIMIKHPQLRDALRNTGVEGAEWFVRYFGAINRWFSAVFTRFNPGFVPINLMRDLTLGLTGVAAELGSGSAGKISALYFQSFGASYRQALRQSGDSSKPNAEKTLDDWAREAAEAGMKSGWTALDDMDTLQRDIENSMRGVGLIAKTGVVGIDAAATYAKMAKDKVVAGFEWIEAVNDGVENGLRLATYIHLRRDKGWTKAKAAEYAKELTVNFNRKGMAGSIINSMYLFYNAAVQGSRRTIQIMKHPKTMGTLAVIGSAQFMLAATLGAAKFGDDEDDETLWEKIPDHVKRRSFVIPTGFDDDGSAQYIAIPMPFGFNAVPAVAGYASNYTNQRWVAKQGGAMALAGNAIGYTTSTVIDALSPIAVGEEDAFWPTIVQMGMQFAANRDSLGRSIAPSDTFNQYETPRAEMYKPGTFTGYVWAARALNRLGLGDQYTPPRVMSGLLDVSPNDLEFLVGQLLGGPGNIMNQTWRMGALAVAGEEIKASDIPIVRTIVGDQRREISEVRAFYGNKDSIERGLDRMRDAFVQDGERGFYEMRAKLGPAFADVGLKIRKEQSEDGRFSAGEPFVNERTGNPTLVSPDGTLLAEYRAAKKELSELNAAVRRVYNDRSLTSAQRQAEIMRINREKGDAVKNVNRLTNRLAAMEAAR